LTKTAGTGPLAGRIDRFAERTSKSAEIMSNANCTSNGELTRENLVEVDVTSHHKKD